jgi:hypothetical protein
VIITDIAFLLSQDDKRQGINSDIPACRVTNVIPTLKIAATSTLHVQEIILLCVIFTSVLAGKPEGRRPLERPRRRRKDNIKMDLTEVE